MRTVVTSTSPSTPRTRVGTRFLDQANNERRAPRDRTRCGSHLHCHGVPDGRLRRRGRQRRHPHRAAPRSSTRAAKIAVLPLSKKDTLTPTAMEVFDCSSVAGWSTTTRRSRSASAMPARTRSAPYCVTVDFDTLDDRAVTVRERDTREQDRVSLDQLEGYLAERLS